MTCRRQSGAGRSRRGGAGVSRGIYAALCQKCAPSARRQTGVFPSPRPARGRGHAPFKIVKRLHYGTRSGAESAAAEHLLLYHVAPQSQRPRAGNIFLKAQNALRLKAAVCPTKIRAFLLGYAAKIKLRGGANAPPRSHFLGYSTPDIRIQRGICPHRHEIYNALTCRKMARAF